MSKKNDRNSGFFLISRELPRRRWRAKKSTCLLGGSSWRGEAKNLLDVLSNWHGTENIQEDEGTVCGVISQQISMRQSLDVGKGGERELCHHSTIKYGIKHSHQGSKTKANCKHGFHSNHWQISIVILQFFFLPLYFLFLLSTSWLRYCFFLLFQFFTLFFHFCLQSLVLVCPVNQDPSYTLGEQSRAHGDKNDEQCVREHGAHLALPSLHSHPLGGKRSRARESKMYTTPRLQDHRVTHPPHNYQ